MPPVSGAIHQATASGTPTAMASVAITPFIYGRLRSQRLAAHRVSRQSSKAGCTSADRPMKSAQNASASATRAITPAMIAASTVSAMRRLTPRWQKFGNSTGRLL